MKLNRTLVSYYSPKIIIVPIMILNNNNNLYSLESELYIKLEYEKNPRFTNSC